MSLARAFAAEGWMGDFEVLLVEALRGYLESHSGALNESFIQEDVGWGGMAGNEEARPVGVCDGGPWIHVDFHWERELAIPVEKMGGKAAIFSARVANSRSQ